VPACPPILDAPRRVRRARYRAARVAEPPAGGKCAEWTGRRVLVTPGRGSRSFTAGQYHAVAAERLRALRPSAPAGRHRPDSSRSCTCTCCTGSGRYGGGARARARGRSGRRSRCSATGVSSAPPWRSGSTGSRTRRSASPTRWLRRDARPRDRAAFTFDRHFRVAGSRRFSAGVLPTRPLKPHLGGEAGAVQARRRDSRATGQEPDRKGVGRAPISSRERDTACAVLDDNDHRGARCWSGTTTTRSRSSRAPLLPTHQGYAPFHRQALVVVGPPVLMERRCCWHRRLRPSKNALSLQARPAASPSSCIPDGLLGDHRRVGAARLKFRTAAGGALRTVAVFEDLYGNRWDSLQPSRDAVGAARLSRREVCSHGRRAATQLRADVAKRPALWPWLDARRF